MTRDKVRAAARHVAAYFEIFRSVFGRRETQTHAQVYLKGLLSCLRRKTCESIALRFAETDDGTPRAEKEVVAMQSFIRNGKWQAGEAMQKVQAAFAKELVPSCDRWSIGTVGVLDESGFEKSGSESVGVARQYCGRLGKVENCQVGVYLVGVTPDGTCPLDQQLFLPKEWIKDKTRRRNTQVPRDIKFQSKPQLGMEMIRRTDEAGKKHLGMADYETRAWTSWHHHMALVALAHFIVTLTRRDVKDNEPDFTLDMAVRVLQSAFARDRCSEDDAFSIIEYHLRRNKAAHQSHRKSWLRKHKRIEVKPLL